jgi:AcrR family transcriptional regulator
MDDVNMTLLKIVKNRAYHHGDLKLSLLSAARRILDREGVDAVTVRAVAREADVAHSAPANHFRGRSALLTELAIGVFAELADEIDGALAASGRKVEKRLCCIRPGRVSLCLAPPKSVPSAVASRQP